MVVNESDLDWTAAADFRRKKLAAADGGDRIGCSLYELLPGERSWPYHYHLIQRGSPAVHGVNETLRVSFAHQNAKRSEDVNESLCDSFASRRNGVPADSSEIKDFRDTRTRGVLGTGGNRVSLFCLAIIDTGTSNQGARARAR